MCDINFLFIIIPKLKRGCGTYCLLWRSFLKKIHFKIWKISWYSTITNLNEARVSHYYFLLCTTILMHGTVFNSRQNSLCAFVCVYPQYQWLEFTPFIIFLRMRTRKFKLLLHTYIIFLLSVLIHKIYLKTLIL